MKKYVLAGASSRALHMYALPIVNDFSDHARLCGIFDINLTRANYISRECGGVPVFDKFDQMLEQTVPDAVIVTTVDRFHHEYIIRALQAGCDAITEKPMTTDAAKCRAILEAERTSGKKVIVTFNYRFTPYVTRIKELIREGQLGDVFSMDFEWFLDTSHGADYFRRWHRNMANSGGLLVHKATHHFDMLNWWIDDEPEEVFALGSRRFYGPTRQKRGERCLTCPHQKTCEFYWDINKSPFAKEFYLAAEEEDAYYRDRCVFAADIDIFDTMAVTVRYAGGALLSYSLNAHSPYEGWRSALNGQNGRIEAEEFHSGSRVRKVYSKLTFITARMP
jgi:predicted dehydrogenase